MNTAAIASLATALAVVITAVTGLIIAVNKARNNAAIQSPNGTKPSFRSALKDIFGPVSTP